MLLTLMSERGTKKMKTIILAITTAILFSVLPLVANAVDISWSSEKYKVIVTADPGISGPPDNIDKTVASKDNLPISASAGSCPEAYAKITSTTMKSLAYDGTLGPCPTGISSAVAFFEGTYNSTEPKFKLDYLVNYDSVMPYLFIWENRVNEDDPPKHNISLSSEERSEELDVAIGQEITVRFGISIHGDNNATTEMTHYATSEADAPEPISSILFIIGGATLGLRRIIKRKLF